MCPEPETFLHRFGVVTEAPARRWINQNRSEGGIVAVSAVLDPSVQVPTTALVWPDARVGPHVIIGDHVTIGSGVVVETRVEIGAGASLGEGTLVREAARVGSKTELRRWCVVDGEVVVGEHQFLGDYVVIDRRTAIGHGGALHQGTRIGGRCVIGDGVIVGAQAQIGSSVMIGVGATIGEYCTIHDNAAVGDSAKLANHALIDREVVYEAGDWLYVVATGYARAPWLTAVWSRRHGLRLWCGWASGFRTVLPPELEAGMQGGRPVADFIREMYGDDSQVPADDFRYLIETVFRHPGLARTIRGATSG